MRVFDLSKGAPSTMTERLWSSASLFAVCRLSMCRHTSFEIPDGDGEGCVVCSGSRLDCSICLPTALAVVSSNDGFCRLDCYVSVRISCRANDARCKTIKFMFDGPHGETDVFL